MSEDTTYSQKEMQEVLEGILTCLHNMNTILETIVKSTCDEVDIAES